MMAKKTKALAKSDDKQLAEAVRTSAQQIWQAGLGAFVKAQEEGGKVFAKLVKEGTNLQKRTQKRAEGKASKVAGTVAIVADSVGKQAAGSWDKLEQVFEDRVSRSLQSLGVPTQKDIQTLTQRIEELNKTVAALSGKKNTVVAKASAKSVAKKAATRPAIARKATSKTATGKSSGKVTTKR
jgi:poly(hydroxyalkanoate) granule-associated protein